MAARGRRVSFHGAFSSRAAATRKHKRVRGSYVLRRRVRGDTRYLVLTRRR